jgi:uncharacterized membrane protein YebE (DUF533 family)
MADTLAQYVISPFDPRVAALPKHLASKNETNALSACRRCKYLEEDHRKEISFLTKNNQELYELNKKLTEQLNQLVKNY